jgi:GMC oxidoreductase
MRASRCGDGRRTTTSGRHLFPAGPSRGSVRLRSADPADPPRINIARLRHPEDMMRMTQATRHARRLSRTPPLAGFVTGAELVSADNEPGSLRVVSTRSPWGLHRASIHVALAGGGRKVLHGEGLGGKGGWMITPVTFLGCPAYIDTHAKMRCGLPAAVTCRYVTNSTESRFKAP